jgi:hypothetical protein
MNAPVLSIVVTVVDGGDALQRCLAALLSQVEAPPLEILVPVETGIAADVTAVVARAHEEGDRVRHLDLGRLPASRAASSAGGQHELIDRRRAGGLAAARGELVAIIEDRAVPRSNWAATAVRLHRELPHLVIGGAVENGRADLLSSAVYYCDFGRYQLPFRPGPRRYISDVNVVYKRRALEATRHVWRDRYHEPLVHWALERAGETLFLSPELVVDEVRGPLTPSGLLVERFAWGRLFGSLRARSASSARRIGLVAAAPLIPAILFGRFVRDRIVKGASVRAMVRVAPAVALLVCAWGAGEAAGYFSRSTGAAD